MPQLYLSVQQFCCLQRCCLYYRFDDIYIYVYMIINTCNAGRCYICFMPQSVMFSLKKGFVVFISSSIFPVHCDQTVQGRYQLPLSSHHRRNLGMMTLLNGSIFRSTVPLCGEFTGYRWIPHTKAGEAGLWCFLWSAPWTNGWVNNREAGDLRRHRAHCDVIVME